MLDIHKCFEYNIHKVNILKRFRLFSLILSFSALLLGLIIYTAFREHTYINSFIPDFIESKIKSCFGFLPEKSFIDFMKYYFADFLWCFALNSALCAVQSSISVKKLTAVSLASFAVGFAFEILQLFSVCIGTFDPADICMYLAASVISVVINIIFLKREGLL